MLRSTCARRAVEIGEWIIVDADGCGSRLLVGDDSGTTVGGLVGGHQTAPGEAEILGVNTGSRQQGQ